MRIRFLSVVMSVVISLPTFAQKTNTDSIKAEMDKIEITNQGMKQVIENYKKGVIKGDLESMNLLALECISGKYVKPNIEMGINLLEDAALQNHVESQYNLGNYLYIFWINKPSNDKYFSQGIKWLKKAIKGGNKRAIVMLARFYSDYGKYKKEPSYVDGGIKMLETYPKIDEVNNKDEEVLNAQACLGTLCLGKWRMDNDTIALRNAKKWYRTLLMSDLEFPNYTQFIDSLQAVLSMGVPMRLDPMPTPEEIEKSKQQANAPVGFGGFPGGGRPGGAPASTPQGPTPPKALFPGGNMQMQQFIRNNTFYPEQLQSQKITGRATVSFTVDTDGSIINPVISNNAEVYIMDKEALRTIMVMPDWIPAQNEDGTILQDQQTITVNFGSGGGMGGMRF